MSRGKKYSELTHEEFMNTPIKELAHMERAEFPKRCAAIAAYHLDKIKKILRGKG